jgi:multiple RNA-binding domain-containing protein 1
MQVMQPRTKKGPSWANEAQTQPELVTSPTGVKTSKPKIIEKAEQAADEEPEKDTREEGMSDLDWMRQRMSQNVDSADVGPEKVFKQSDEEDGEVEAPREVRISDTVILRISLYKIL